MLSTHRKVTRFAGLLVVASFVFAACSSSGSSTAPSAAGVDRHRPASAPASAGCVGSGVGRRRPNMDALIAAAKAEGSLNTIALPRDWCNYGEASSTVHRQVRDPDQRAQPGGGSKDELEAIKANKTTPARRRPDVVDVGLCVRPQGVTKDALPAVQGRDLGLDPRDRQGRRRHRGTATTTASCRSRSTPRSSPTARRTGPTCSSPSTRTRSPSPATRRTSNQAIQAVWASALANGGSLDNAEPGLDFFKKLNDAGNFVPVIANAATVASGETPIRLAWTYNALADKDSLKGNPHDRGRRPDDRPLRRHVRPGHQQVRAASERRQAVDGVPLLRRGSERVAEGLLRPDPLRGHGRRGVVPADRGQAAGHHGRRPPDPGQITAATDADHQGLGPPSASRPAATPAP